MTTSNEADRDQTSLFFSLRQLFPYAKPFAPRLAAGILAAVSAAIIGLTIPQVLQRIVNGALAVDASARVLWIGVAIVAALGISEAALVALRRHFVITPGTILEADLRVRLYTHLVALSPAFHDRWSGGQLLARSMSDIRRFRRWLSFGMVMTVVNSITLIVGITFITLIEWRLGIIYLGGAVPAFLLCLRARKRYRKLSRRSQDQAGDLGNTVEESVQGIRVLKAYGRELTALEDFTDQAEELRSTEIGKARERAYISFLMTAVPDCLLGLLLIVGVWRVSTDHLTVGGLLAAFATAMILSGPLERLSDQFTMSMEAKTAIDRFLEALHAQDELPAPRNTKSLPKHGTGAVEFTDVAFSYGHLAANQPILRGASLTLEPGSTVALVGLTGSGKSTLAQLLARFYDVDSGSITIDGIDIRDLSHDDLRAAISVAFEQPLLFSATVRTNVAWGKPDATDEQIWEALEVAQAHFVKHLPEGLDTKIGEEGLSLSGGQRQRISLARAILPRPRVLILDDPLSALDVRTESVVAARLREHLRGTTTLLIASRPSTVAIADRVGVVHEGEVIATGVHEELSLCNPIYRTIVFGEDSAGATDERQPV